MPREKSSITLIIHQNHGFVCVQLSTPPLMLNVCHRRHLHRHAGHLLQFSLPAVYRTERVFALFQEAGWKMRSIVVMIWKIVQNRSTSISLTAVARRICPHSRQWEKELLHKIYGAISPPTRVWLAPIWNFHFLDPLLERFEQNSPRYSLDPIFQSRIAYKQASSLYCEQSSGAHDSRTKLLLPHIEKSIHIFIVGKWMETHNSLDRCIH